MRTDYGAKVYEASTRFVDSCLKADDSLFTPGRPIWTAETAEDLYRHYNLQPDTSSDSFVAKLKKQLESAPDPTIQLMAEALYVHQLIVDDIGAHAKRNLLNEVLSWMQSPLQLPPELDDVLSHGFISGGLAFKTLRPFQLHYMVEFARLWKGLDEGVRRAALTDPWRFKEILWRVPIEKGYAQREALLHLVFPDVFEEIVSREHKDRIAGAFSDLVKDSTTDVDRRLGQIREGLQANLGGPFSFYDPEVRPLWNADADQPELWDQYVEWGRRMMKLPGFAEQERGYKLRLVAMLRPVVDALATGGEWLEPFSKALHSKENNVIRWQAVQPLLDWCTNSPDEAADALKKLWEPETSLRLRLKGFIEMLPEGVMSGSDLLRTISTLLMGFRPTDYPPMAADPLSKSCRLTGFPPPSPGGGESVRYRHSLAFLDRFMKEAQARGVELPDRLEAQGVMWTITEWPIPDSWPTGDQEAFRLWRAGETGTATPTPTPSGQLEPKPPPTGSLQDLADALYVPVDFLDDMVSSLRDRKQLIIYGPPGTGKTHVATHLARYLAPDEDRRKIVQFHPSYSYEDFVQGYRPVADGGAMSYQLRPGPLLDLVSRASEDDREYILIIDEINRGNLPRILGELLFALEYRDQAVDLMYGGGKLQLPNKLLILGTMNTADRSIGLIDAALRRRFNFVRMFPGEGPLSDLLRRWLDENRPEMLHVADIVDRLNSRLRDQVGPHLQVGHSYFLRDDLTEELLARIWDTNILPFLEDQFFGKEDELKSFSLDNIRAEKNADDSSSGTTDDALPAIES